MHLGHSLLPALPLVAAGLLASPDAAACGGCFHEPGEAENTQVTGHRMIFSISQKETTLWDQFSYAGNPTSFAWVLPIHGTVTVGLSSDALFQNLDTQTQVTVVQPSTGCPGPPSCFGTTTTFTTTNGGGFDAGNVTVIAQQVVGPYQTVQLASTDPSALATWLSTNGYAIPAGFASTIGAYVTEGFDFLALKLLPGKDVTSMRPVRVTTPGAGASLPLRMVAAGVGVTTPITLWVFGEGRYQPMSFPFFTITGDELVWDFASSSSNYKALRQAGFNLSNGRGWLLEASVPFSEFQLQGALQGLVATQPAMSGYADDMGMGAEQALTLDLAKLWGNIDSAKLWVTRTRAELPRAALDTDLTLGASSDQTPLGLSLYPGKSINTPVCPTYPPCPGSSSSGGGGMGGSGGAGGAGGAPSDGSSAGCSVGGVGERSAALTTLALALALMASRRRRVR